MKKIQFTKLKLKNIKNSAKYYFLTEVVNLKTIYLILENFYNLPKSIIGNRSRTILIEKTTFVSLT